jgi:hypothetical protein
MVLGLVLDLRSDGASSAQVVSFDGTCVLVHAVGLTTDVYGGLSEGTLAKLRTLTMPRRFLTEDRAQTISRWAKKPLLAKEPLWETLSLLGAGEEEAILKEADRIASVRGRGGSCGGGSEGSEGLSGERDRSGGAGAHRAAPHDQVAEPSGSQHVGKRKRGGGGKEEEEAV